MSSEKLVEKETIRDSSDVDRHGQKSELSNLIWMLDFGEFDTGQVICMVCRTSTGEKYA